MIYRPRHIEAKLGRYRAVFPALLLTGPRQAGKSTVLNHLFGAEMHQVVFDPVIDIGGARRDPEFFLDQHPPPVILDEIQYAPELLPVLKRRIDRNPAPGQYILTGSQNLSLLRNISESMAGRVMVMELGPMTLAERTGMAGSRELWLEVLLAGADAPSDFAECPRSPRKAPLTTVFDILWRGGYPGTLDHPNDLLPDIFRSYVRTYVERDIRLMAEVSDQQTFSRFLSLCAATTAQEANYSQLGRDIGVTPQTASRWSGILKATCQWIEVPPYHGNTVKRVSGKPKGYLTDTGLASFFQRISSPEALSGHPLLGSLFETHVATAIHHLFGSMSAPPMAHHWRSHGGAEVDLLLERDGLFWPIEIKSAARITDHDARGIHAFRSTYPQLRHGSGLIIAPVETVTALRDRVMVLPFDLM